MSTEIPAPRRVEWTGPARWTVWADEDGVHVRTPGGDGLEQPEMQALVGLWSLAIQAGASGSVPAPKTPDLPF